MEGSAFGRVKGTDSMSRRLVTVVRSGGNFGERKEKEKEKKRKRKRKEKIRVRQVVRSKLNAEEERPTAMRGAPRKQSSG